MFFLFRKKERTKEKSIAFGLFTRRFVWIRTFYGILYWEGAFAFFRRLSRPEPAALAMLAALPLTAHCYLLRFGIPRAGFWLSQMLFTRGVFTAAAAQRVIRGASRAGPYIGAPSAGNARLPQSGCIRISSLAAPAINQSGRGSYAVFIALLYERLTRLESGTYLCTAVYGTAAPFLNSAFRILPAPAINQNGRGSCAVFIALLYERLTRPESSVSLRAAVYGTAAPFLIPHSALAISVGADCAVRFHKRSRQPINNIARIH